MGIIEIPKDSNEKLLTYATLFDAVGYMGFAPFVYFLKIGYVWHDAGPILGFPIHLNGYLNMILAVYFVAGIYLLRVAKDGVKKHAMVLSLNAWGLQFIHMVMMGINCLILPFDGYSLWGIPANILPFGDIPFVAMLFTINIFLMKKVFGSYCP